MHDRMQDALAGADYFLIELTELGGRLGREDVGEGQVGDVAAVG